MATYGREIEVDNFLKSILNSKFDISSVQIIIVDQNEKIDLAKYIDTYNNTLNILHIKSNVRGLSQNRNIGLKKAEGEIIAFPDDDCEYLPDTLLNVYNLFESRYSDVIMGKIVERDGSDSLRKWPKKEMKISKSNFFTKCSSVTMFIRSMGEILEFNEKLGVGNIFGSCEDSDMLYNLLKKKNICKYNFNIEIYHPHYDNSKNMDCEKVKRYGLGFGGFVRSNLDINLIILFFQIITYHFIKVIIGIITFNKEKIKKSWISAISRIIGIITYK